MALITFTTDLGTRDYYLAAIKGAIITHCEGYVPMVDVTHSVKSFDIREAAISLRNSYRYFPEGTIHVVHVNSTDGGGKLLLAVVEGHYFITFDNGFLSLAFGKTPHETYQINEELLEGHSLLYEKAIGRVVNLLLTEYRPADFAQLTTETKSFRLLQPITSRGNIKGIITYIDNYGNAVSNITQQMFQEFIGDRSFTVTLNVGFTKTISTHYDEVEEGDLVCLFNTAGLLEIAINKGQAKNLLGLKQESVVLVTAD